MESLPPLPEPEWEELKKQLPPGTPKPDDSLLVAGSLVFTPSSGPIDLREMNAWWRWVPGRKRLDMDFGRAITEIIA